MAFWRNSLLTGALATIGTTLAASLLGRSEDQSLAGPINAVSHILWGEEATSVDDVDLKHTLAGGIINSAAVTSWAALQELFLSRKKSVEPIEAVATGAAVAAIAYAVDYHVVPKRLTPGFEERLSGRSMFGVYAVLGACLAVGALLRED